MKQISPAKKPARLKPSPLRLFRRLLIPALVILLLSVFASLSLVESSKESATADEVSHIPAGVLYVQAHDYWMNPEHPMLIKYLSGLSAQAFAHPHVNKNLIGYKVHNQWLFGSELLYSTPGNNPDKIVFWGRLPVLILAVVLGVLIFLLARSMFGQAVGIAALALYCSDPTMIAYSHLVTFDLSMTTFVTAAIYCLWSAYKKYSWAKCMLAGCFFGLALISKMSALSSLLLVHLFMIPIAMKLKRDVRGKFYLKNIVLVYAASFVTIWLAYLFMMGGKVWQHATILPGAFTDALVKGLVQYSGVKTTYLLGRVSSTGLWWYFPVSFIAKSTLAMLALLLGGVGYAYRYKDRLLTSVKALFLLAPVLLTLALASASRFDIGLRLIFVIYPSLFILAGCVMVYVLRNFKRAYVVLAAVAAYYVLTLVSAYPNYLAYSNELFGGRQNSYRYLADSNLDWGQGLPQLKTYAEQHHIAQMPIIYFGSAAPSYYGFSEVAAGMPPFNKNWLNQHLPTSGGWLAISASTADYNGLHAADYKIRGVYPKDIVAGSILVYKLPGS
jgi:hypothetical protein